ncbi:MAG: hypothetical protein ACLQFR_05000 [Streptosporangiaceae bacterium]
MSSTQTTAHQQASHAAAAVVLTPGASGAAIHSRWQSLRDQVRGEFAADHRVPGRRGLQLCLGLIWLLDAALQFQPFMFRPSFVSTVIEPAAAGNPAFVTSSVSWASQLMLHQVAVFNAAFATVQLLIAAGLFFRRTVKPALALSIVWALSVWWFGESLGGIFIGASPLAGVPGAVLLYALIAVLVWPSAPPSAGYPTSVATAGPARGTATQLFWLVLWGSFAHYLLLPANRAPGAISELLSHTDGQPGWITTIMDSLSRAADHHGVEISVVLAILCAGIALAVLAEPLIRPAVMLAAAVGILFWIAQGLGGIFTGQGTDPNTGLLLILLAACYLPRRAHQTS